MSLAELRNELREHRKTAAPAVSRMKKADIVRELERTHLQREKRVEKELSDEEEDVKKVLKKEKVPKATAKKIIEAEQSEHKKQVKEMKKADKEEEVSIKKKSLQKKK